jgi:hypothetical protein
MKKITFLLMLVTTTIMSAQQVVVQNFETPTSFTFAGFEGLSSATIDVDPAAGGTRLNNLKLVSQSTGNPWQGAEIVQTDAIIKLTTDKTIKIDVYSTQAFTMLAKVELGTGPISACSQAYTTPNAWQTLTFTFTQSLDGTGVANGSYQKLVFFPNWKATNDGFNSPPGNFAVYVDNVTSETAAVIPPAQPATAAPTPPNRPAADVKSIFSNAYAPIAVLGYTGDDNTYNTTWCGATTSLVSIVGNDTNKVTGLGCEGVAFQAGRFNASSFTHFHMDFWTETPTLDKSFNIKFSNWAGGTGEANAIEFSTTNANFLTNPNPGTWISLDIPLTSFLPVNGSDRSDLVQFVISSDLGTVYYDNLYLHKNTTLGTSNFTDAKVNMYPNPTKNTFTIEAKNNIQNVSVVNMLGQEILKNSPNKLSTSLDLSSFQNGVYVVKTTVDGNVTSSKIIKE